MAHNKLYRNFIILQECEKGNSVSKDKALSGYAKVEAKGDKCKVSFYAQNLKPENAYSMVLICCKKDSKQLINLGKLSINEIGKGDTSQEYYINNIAGLNITYDKISGAAICKSNGNDSEFVMYGFMNGEESTENWRSFRMIKSGERKVEDKKPEVKAINTEKVKEAAENETQIERNNKIVNSPAKEEKIIEDKCSNEKTINTTTNNSIDLDMDDDTDIRHHKKNHDKKDMMEEVDKMEENIELLIAELEDYDGPMNFYINDEKQEFMFWGIIKLKTDSGCKWKKIKIDKKKCLEIKEKDKHDCKNKRIEENTVLDKIDFEEYEREIEKIKYSDGFQIRGKAGQYFEKLAEDFTPYGNKLNDIDYCKWYKVNVNSIEDLCNKSNYNRYTLAYYPMLNYYPYINKDKHFLLGYKCDKTGELQYIVYGIPGGKDKNDQPFGGKTGFVTWTNDDSRNQGYWLMFYDYKNATIVVPMK